MIDGIFVEGLIFGLMALGVFITFRVLDFPDLTVDGSFPMGAVIMASCVNHDVNIFAALILSFMGGILAGVITALIHNKLKVPNLLAGILTMTMLYSINIRILGNRSNLHLPEDAVLIDKISKLTQGYISEEYVGLIFFIIIVILLKMLMDIFFRTDLGLTLGAMGNNQQMVLTQGVNPEYLKMIGVGISNGIVALAGAFYAQYQGFSDIGMGTGIIIAGLASVMIGELLFSSNKISVLTFKVLLGALLYKAIMYTGRNFGFKIYLNPNDLKLIEGLLVIAALLITKFKKKKLGRV